MFGTIRRHQTWLWGVIITLTIVSFVWFFSPYTKLNNASGPRDVGSMNGHRITREDFFKAQRENDLRYFFMSGGGWPGEEAKSRGFDEEIETFKWLLVIQKQDELGIHISDDRVAQAARDMLGRFQATPAVFVEKVLQPHGRDLEDFERYVRHNLGFQELIATVGLSGKLVTPQEAKGLYVRENEEMATEAVFFSASNYLANVNVTPEAVAQFYSNHMAELRIPEQVQVAYVKFGISNLLAEAEAELVKTNLTEIIEANYKRLPTNYFKDAKTPEEIKARIREELIRGRALSVAHKSALEFAAPLFEIDPPQAADLEKKAKEKGLTVAVSEPFDRTEGPKSFEVGQDFTKAAFALAPDQPFGGPFVGKDGVYVIAMHTRISSRIPPLDEVRARVVEEFKNSQATELARQAGRAFYLTLTNGLAQGKTFTNLCAEAKVAPTALAPFALSTRRLVEAEEHVSLDQLKMMAFRTPAGKVSEFEQTPEGGLVLHVVSRLPIDETKMNAMLPTFVQNVRQKRQEDAFNEWFGREMNKNAQFFRPREPARGRTAKS